MAVVIRLQGLPVSAGSVDIRHFFSGLQIPDGGVHIIGGKLGEAFIIFATDEDARRGMSRTGGVIKNLHVNLSLSSKTEMQSTLETSRKTNKNPKHPAVPPSGDMNRLEMAKKEGNQSSASKYNESYVPKYDKKETYSNDIYVSCYGLPYSVTMEDIIQFFKDLDVVEVVFFLRLGGLKTGTALVKFASATHANAALSFNNEYIGHRFISISKSTEEKWGKALKKGELHSKPRNRTRSRSPQNQQFYVHLKNLPFTVQKPDIRHFFSAPDMADSQIKFLLNKHNNRTREGFIMLKSERLYEKCLALRKKELKGRHVLILPIARKAMLQLIESYETQSPPKQLDTYEEYPPQRSMYGEHPKQRNSYGEYPQQRDMYEEYPQQRDTYEEYPRPEPSNLNRCVYLRNFPFDVSKIEVQKFFDGFLVHEDNIFLLFDNKGVGLGEALVRFQSEEQAMRAEVLNRQPFLGTEVFLRRISDEQAKEFGAFNNTPVAQFQGYKDGYMKVPLPEANENSYMGENYNRKEFRSSPERQRGSYAMEMGGRDESYDRFDSRNANYNDYNNSFSAAARNFDRSSGAIIRMTNLPYAITNEEILDFFYGYNIIPDSIDVKFNRKGMSTGHATVCTHSYEEAMTAVNELSDRPIGSRNISLSLTKI
ncbi:RNA-binding protein 12B [Phyllobates terribilis]|uniref:RNA-binding protein 12B n=1 Tax=Phyllobates terribilis TaxID=111132 RepID=UPI003CCB0A54